MNRRNLKRITTVVVPASLMFLDVVSRSVHTRTGIEPDAGKWRTHVLDSGNELRLPAPPTGPAAQV